MRHVTLTTGHERESPRSEVAPGVLRLVGRLLERALTGEVVPLPERVQPACTLTATARGYALLATVHAGGDALVWIGVARVDDEDARGVWRELHEAPGLPLPGITAPDASPPAPWCAVRLEAGVARHPAAAEWLGDFERCLAWAWLTRRGS